MQTVVVQSLGSFDAVVLEERPAPEAGPGQLLLKVEAVGLGFVDGLLVLGRYQVKPELPFVPGNEIAGRIVGLGADESGWAIGDRVAAATFGGGLAEYCVVPANAAHRLPPSVSAPTAAAMLVNYATALHGLKDRAKLQPGETLLVLGAGGGVGTAAIEVGKRLGARVIASASSGAKRDLALSLGADLALDSTAEDWRQAVKAATHTKGVDVVFDPVGGSLFESAFRSLAWSGRHLVVGFAAGAIPALPANLALLKGAGLLGVDLRQFSLQQPAAARTNLATLFEWAANGHLRVPIGASFGLAQAPAALAASMARDTQGKVVVEMAAPPG